MTKDHRTFFQEIGYKRYKCKKCGSFFWSKEERDYCPECRHYTFLFHEKIKFKKYENTDQVRNDFLNYWANIEIPHEILKPYPIVARWREDVYLVNASIYDFQPTGGIRPDTKIIVPANPLTISQPCVRETDFDNIGITGRHFAIFEMMAHHAFNDENKFIYWKYDAARFVFNLFTTIFGANENQITFLESSWEGGGNAGESFEVWVGGIELANIVFMDKYWNGNRYVEMKKKIIDTGYGLERILWVGSRRKTSYIPLFDEILKFVMKELGKELNEDFVGHIHQIASEIKFDDTKDFDLLFTKIAEYYNLSKEEVREEVMFYKYLFGLLDFTKAISLLLGDLAVPSNREEGYTVRLLIRKAYNYADYIGLKELLDEILKLQIYKWGRVWEQIYNNYPYIIEVFFNEIDKYEKSLEKAFKVFKKKVREKLTEKDIRELYESYGIPKEIIEKEFNIKISKNLFKKEEKRKEEKIDEEKEWLRKIVVEYPPTEKVYYKSEYKREDFVNILGIHSKKKFFYIVLDKTIFYPEGGGQPGDIGIIDNYEVIDTFKIKDVIVHKAIKRFDNRGTVLIGFKNVLFDFEKCSLDLYNFLKKELGKLADEIWMKYNTSLFTFEELLNQYNVYDKFLKNFFKKKVLSELYFNKDLINYLKSLLNRKYKLILIVESVEPLFRKLIEEIVSYIEKKYSLNFEEIIFFDKNAKLVEWKLLIDAIANKYGKNIIYIDSDKNAIKKARKLRNEYRNVFVRPMLYKFGEKIQNIKEFVREKETYIAIDWKRRYHLMKSHTATHLLIAACREFLGKHVWQFGAQKGEISRLDIRHYKKITESELEEIEKLVNEYIRRRIKVRKFFENKIDAERKYGFIIYQGGAPYSEKIRIVKIGKIDVQACGGTHVNNTDEINAFKILKRESIADGVERIYFTVDEKIIEIYKEKERIIKELREIYRCEEKDLVKVGKRFFEEWKDFREEIKKLKEKLIEISLLFGNGEAKLDFDDLGLFIKVVNSLKDKFNNILIVGNKVGYCYSKEGKAKSLLKEKGFKRIVGTDNEAKGFI